MMKSYDIQLRIIHLKNVIDSAAQEISELELSMEGNAVWENISCTDIDGEKWIPIIGYENFYHVSNMGRVKSLSRFVKRQRKDTDVNSDFFTKEKILIPTNDGDGYHKVTLYVKGKLKSCKLHRLVATHFLDNPENKEEVNHKNGIKRDNRLENLEFVTTRENLIHAFKTGLKKVKPEFLATGADNPKSKPVEQYTLNGEYIKTFAGQGEAARALGITQSCIWANINGRTKNGGGWIWKYPAGISKGKSGAEKGKKNYYSA